MGCCVYFDEEPANVGLFEDRGLTGLSSLAFMASSSGLNRRVSERILNSKIKRKSDNDESASGKKLCHEPLSQHGSEDFDDNHSLEGDDELDADGAQWLQTFCSWPASKRIRALTHLVHVCDADQIRHVKRVIEPYFQRDFVSLLPKELALYVLSFLDPRDLLRCAQTCRHWRSVAEDSLLWKELCEESAMDEDLVPPSTTAKACATGSTTKSPAASSCFARSPWKAAYLRHCRIDLNWRKNALPEPAVLRGHDEHVITCLLIHDGKIVSGSDDNTLRIWSISSGQCLRTLNGHTGGVWSAQITDDGRYVVSGSTDRTVRVWDMESGANVHVLQGHMSTVRCMALKGTKLVSGSRDTMLRVWDVSSGVCEHILNGHFSAIRCVQFDGRRAVSGAYDYTLKVWDVETETCVHTLVGHANRVYSLEFDSERHLVISGSLDTTIRVWNIREGTCLHTLVGHRSLNSDMQLHGNMLISGNADSTIKVWDIVNGTCLQTLAGTNKHSSAVTCLQFLENSGLLLTSSDDGTVKLWDTFTGQFIRDVVRLESCGSGSVVWRLRATATKLVCAVGSRNGIEDTKLLILDFDADYP